MFASNPIHYRPHLILIAMGIVILAVLSLQSLDVPVRQDVTNGPDTSPVIEDWRGNSGSLPPVPPIRQ